MIKQGQIVKYLGIKNNLHGDTHVAEEKGYLIPGRNYKVAMTGSNQKYITLIVEGDDFRTWTLAAECVSAEPRYKKNLPSWF